MGKDNNLKDYLTDLYEGIAKKKANASRNPQNFRSEIESIETDSPLPIQIKSEAEMNALLNKATPVGAIYRYMGATTETYTYATNYQFVHLDEAGTIFGFKKLVGLYPAPNNEVNITENGTYDVTFKDTVNVNVESVDNTKPPEIVIEEDAEALPVGSVFRFMGSGLTTLETGAYYLVESNGYTVSVTSTNRDVYVYDEAPTNETIALGTVSSGSTVDFIISTGKLYIVEESAMNLTSHNETEDVTYETFLQINGHYCTEYTVTGDGTVSVTYGGWG